jgi:hypothetical protein
MSFYRVDDLSGGDEKLSEGKVAGIAGMALSSWLSNPAFA